MRDSTKVIAFGEYTLDFGRAELRSGEKSVDVQPTPLRLLLYLAEHRDRIVSRQELLDAIWPGVVVGDEALTTALAEARHAVGDDGAAQRVIRTRKGRGYRFVAEVVEAAGPAADAPEVLAGRRGQRKTLVGAAAAGLLLLAITAVALMRMKPEAPGNLAPYGIAVLPIANLNGDAEGEALAGGLTNQITQTLSGAGYPVVARTTAAQWKERGTDVRELAATLGVSHVVEGSVQRDRGRVRVTMQLVATDDGRPVWSEAFEHPVGDLFTIQDRIAARVSVQAFQHVWEEEALMNRNPELAQISRRFIEMRALFFAARYDDHFAAAERLLADMPEREPFLALRAATHGTMAVAWANLNANAHRPFREAGPKMLSHAQAAVALAPDEPFTHHVFSRVLVQHWRWEEAEREMRRACELAPREGILCGSTMSVLCHATGCPEELEGARLWQEQYSGQAGSWYMLSAALFRADLIDEAVAASMRAAQLEEWYGLRLPALQWHLGKREEAVESLRRRAVATGASAFAREIERLATSGPEAVWRRAADLAVSRDASVLAIYPWPAYQAASNYAQLGEVDLALDGLERAFAKHEAGLLGMTSPVFDPIRDTPRFRAIVEKMGLTAYHAKYLKRPRVASPVAPPRST